MDDLPEFGSIYNFSSPGVPAPAPTPEYKFASPQQQKGLVSDKREKTHIEGVSPELIELAIKTLSAPRPARSTRISLGRKI